MVFCYHLSWILFQNYINLDLIHNIKYFNYIQSKFDLIRDIILNMDLDEINKELSEIEALDLNSESKYYFLFSDSISILQTIVFRNENSDFRVSESITIFIDSIDMLIQENLDIKNYSIEIEKLIENHYLFSEVSILFDNLTNYLNSIKKIDKDIFDELRDSLMLNIKL